MFSLLPAANPGGDGAVQWDQTEVLVPSVLSGNEQDVGSYGQNHQPMPVSVWDQLAAPTVFLQQALVFKGHLDTAALRYATQVVVNSHPIFAARAVTAVGRQRYQLVLDAAAGVAFVQGTAKEPLLQELSQQLQAAAPATASGATRADGSKFELLDLPNLANALFGHLPGALVPHYIDQQDLHLTHVAVVTQRHPLMPEISSEGQLHNELLSTTCQTATQSGSQDASLVILGVRLSHFLGDWTSLRLLLRSIAAAYRSLKRLQQLPSQPAPAVPEDPALASAASLLNHHIITARQQLPADFQPVGFKLLQPEDTAVFTKLGQMGSTSSTTSSPRQLTLYASQSYIQTLKQQALHDLDHITAAAAAAVPAETSECSMQHLRHVCSSHNVLLAKVVQLFSSLPGRPGVPQDVSVAVDMRGRLLQQAAVEQQQLRNAVGNFFASAIAQNVVAETMSFGQLVLSLAQAIKRSCDLWVPDLAWASLVMGITDQELLSPAACMSLTSATTPTVSNKAAAPEAAPAEEAAPAAGLPAAVSVDVQPVKQQQQQQQQVTWRRLHAMGPRELLEQQRQLGLLPSLSCTQWPLDVAADAALGDQVPLLVAPSFSQPQPYPLVLQQQAPPAMGGGVLVHLCLDPEEADLFVQKLQAASHGSVLMFARSAIGIDY